MDLNITSMLESKIERKKSFFIPFIIFVILAIFSAWNYENADYINYEWRYSLDMESMSVMEITDMGFAVIMWIFHLLGAKFELFHVVLYVTLMMFITYIIYKKSYQPVLILLFYLLTLYVRDIVQFRNAIAMVPFTIGLFSYLNIEDKNRKKKFVVCNLIASTIHLGFLFYFVFLLDSIKINKKILLFLIVVLSLFGRTFLQNFVTLDLVSSNDNLQAKAEGYANTNVSWAYAFTAVNLAINLFVCYYSKRKLPPPYSEKYDRFYYINVLACSILILSGINATMFRLHNNLLLVNSIYLFNAIKLKKDPNFNLAVYFWTIWFIYWTFLNSAYFGELSNILKYNHLISL